MKTKQWIWLIIAAAVFIIGGVISVAINTWSAGVFSSLDSIDLESASMPLEPYVARVDISGTITSAESTSLTSSDTFSESYLLDYIDRLQNDENNVGILLYVDSGGGEMTASDEIYLALMEYKEVTGRPIYAYFDSTACSGAYYIAMSADEIWANRNCTCVNIGVYISTYNVSGLFEKYGIEQIMIKSSDNKGIGAIGIEWTDEQKEIYQSIVDLYYEQFLEVVADGRDMTTAEVKRLDDGREMLASQALDAGFIDGIGRYDDYETQVLGYFDEGTTLYEEEYESNTLLSLVEQYLGLTQNNNASDLSILQQLMEQSSSGVKVMAYAG